MYGEHRCGKNHKGDMEMLGFCGWGKYCVTHAGKIYYLNLSTLVFGVISRSHLLRLLSSFLTVSTNKNSPVGHNHRQAHTYSSNSKLSNQPVF